MAGGFIRHHYHSFQTSFGMGVDFKRTPRYRDSASPRTLPKRTPYHGYYFKILSRQGAHAPGGKHNHLINGNTIGGYVLVAYPDKWGSSGVMTFIVNKQGRVYQKNFGPRAAQS